MFKKNCTRCLNTSFSSARNESWQCPYCGYDLKDEKAFQVDHSHNFSLTNKRLEQQRGFEIYNLRRI